MGGSLKAAGFGDGCECQRLAKHVLLYIRVIFFKMQLAMILLFDYGGHFAQIERKSVVLK